MAGLLMLLGRTMLMAANRTMYEEPAAKNERNASAQTHWATYPSTLNAALREAATLVYALRVQGERPKLDLHFASEMGRALRSPKYARETGMHPAYLDELESIRQLLGPDIVRRLSTIKGGIPKEPPKGGAEPLTRGPAPGQSAEVTSQAIADAVLNLVNSTPNTPTREEIVSAVLTKLNAVKEVRSE